MINRIRIPKHQLFGALFVCLLLICFLHLASWTWTPCCRNAASNSSKGRPMIVDSEPLTELNKLTPIKIVSVCV